MFGNLFYNEGMRKIIIAFGQLFNNIVIQSTSSTGAVTKRLKVPLAYAPKEKFLVRLDQKPDLDDRSFAITLPRLGFEISGLAYDPTRKLTRVQKVIIEETNEELNQTNEEILAQRDEIERQKNIVDVAHGEIKDSIKYAKRIQSCYSACQRACKKINYNLFLSSLLFFGRVPVFLFRARLTTFSTSFAVNL